MHCSIWPDDLGWALRRLAVTDLRDHARELPDFYIAVVHPSTSVCECCNVIRRLEFITRFDMPLCVKDIRPVPCHPAHQLQIKPRPLRLLLGPCAGGVHSPVLTSLVFLSPAAPSIPSPTSDLDCCCCTDCCCIGRAM